MCVASASENRTSFWMPYFSRCLWAPAACQEPFWAPTWGRGCRHLRVGPKGGLRVGSEAGIALSGGPRVGRACGLWR